MKKNKLDNIPHDVELNNTVDFPQKPIKHIDDYNFDSLVSNWRLLEKDLTHIKYDAIHVQGKQKKLVTIDFSDYKLPSPRTGELQPLTNFPHVCHCLVYFVAERLIGYTCNSLIRPKISQSFNMVLKFFYYLFLRNKYYLRDATMSDTNAFALEMAKGGTHKALNLENKYREIQSRIEKDKDYAKVISYSQTSTNIVLSRKMIQDKIGVTPSMHIAPTYIYESAYKIHNPDEKGTGSKKGYTANDELCNLTIYYLSIMNSLYLLGDETDRLTFIPFLDTANTFRELTGKTIGRTENVSLEDAISILKVCNTWIYDYADNLISFGESYRKKLQEYSNLGTYSKKRARIKWIKDFWIQLKRKKKLPFHDGNMTMFNFNTLIQTLQTACMVMIAINNGRRKNEIIGMDRDFGLYYGCIKSSQCGFIDNHTIDIYIEKTIKGYCEMSCNTLTRDAVLLLEKIYVLLRPLGEKIPCYKNDRLEARKEKLLIIKNFTEEGIKGKPGKFREGNEKYFYSLAKLKNDKLHARHHPYRRLFAMLYFYRYKMASLPALSQQLKHLNYEMTLVYINDDKTRMSKDRLEKLYKMYRSENGVMDGIITETEHEFLKDLVGLTLKGKTAGGLSKRIIRIHKWLLRSTIKGNNTVSYKDTGEKQKIEVLTGALEKKGYGAKPRKHGICGSNNKKGKCFDDTTGVLMREKGVPTLCVTCPVHLFTSKFVENLREDKVKLHAAIDNYDLPRAERKAATKGLEKLDNLILLEEKMLHEAMNHV